MKENFVIREERHPGAKSVAKIAETGMYVCGALWFLFAFLAANADDYDTCFTYWGIANVAVFWTGLLLIITFIIKLAVKECLVCGFSVDGLQVKVEISNNWDGELVKVREFVVNGKACDNTAMIEGGHKIELIAAGDIDGTSILLDEETIAENGLVYVDKIHEILSGAPSNANQPLPVDTSVMPPFQTILSNNSAERTVAPKTKRYAIVGETGKYANHQFNITDMLVLGRDAAECGLAFPADTAGVSRVHCKLVVEIDGLCVYDLGSTYGTVVNNNKTISANQMMKVNHGDTITIGSSQTFVVKEM